MTRTTHLITAIILAGLVIGAIPPSPSAAAEGPCDSLIVVSPEQSALQADCRVVWAFFQQLEDTGTLGDPGPGMWGSETSLSSWDGVIIDPAIGRVTELRLQGKGLTGRIPPVLGQLTELRNLDLSYNGFSGSIPVQLSRLANLTRLHLGHNHLTGSIPTHLARLIELQELYLFLNRFTGVIPDEMGNLSAIEQLSLSGNRLTGTIPDELGKLSEIEYLNLSSNQLQGDIPTDLLDLTNLHHLDLSYNELSGSIPFGSGWIQNLCELHLSYNQLTGPIPSELGYLSNRQCYIYIKLENNWLTGTIPISLGQLPNLRGLDLSQNRLSGSIPAVLGNATKLVYLQLGNNELTGTIPAELSQLTNLWYLDLLRGNEIAGRTPASLVRLETFGGDPLRLIPYSKLIQDATIENQIWNVWFCKTPSPDLTLDREPILSLLNSEVTSYFSWLSNERYRPEFHYAGLVSGDSRQDCDQKTEKGKGTLPVLVIDDTQEDGGYAFRGRAVVAGTTVIEIPRLLEPVLGTLVHEMGHVLGFPHSYGGNVKWSPGSILSGVHEYDNPMDIMSGDVGFGLTTGTIAMNRYAAGWIDPENVAIHEPGDTAIYELAFSDPRSIQMLVLPGEQMGTFTALGVRTAAEYDIGIPKEGVEVYGVTTGPEFQCRRARWLQCSGTRRIQPYPPAPALVIGDREDKLRAIADLVHHVHTVGDVFRIGRITVEVMERIGDRYWVWVADASNPADVPVRPFAGRFSDDEGNVHEAGIDLIAGLGITAGCNPPDNDRYCPSAVVTRAQMMVFLARALGVEVDTGRTGSRFADVPDGAWYLPYVERLADLGIVEAGKDGSFRPSEALTRLEMAVFLTRSFPTVSPVAEPAGVFSDVASDAEFAAEVEGLLAAGITGGCTTEPLLYCPDDPVPRDQMASFLARVLDEAG